MTQRDSRGRFIKGGGSAGGMIGMRVSITDETQQVIKAARKANIRNLAHAAATVRKTAQKSIKGGKSKKPSPPGQPPRTRRGNKLRRAILFAVEGHQQTAVIGPGAHRVGTSALAHEFGGFYKAAKYPARPFMRPALEANLARMPAIWGNSIKQT